MDELTFRRAVLADPQTRDPEVIAAAKNNPQLHAFWSDIKAQDNALSKMLNATPVPNNLADKLLWQNQAQTSVAEFSPAKRQRPWYYAIAASVVIGLSATMLYLPTKDRSILDAAYAHTQHKHVFEILTSTTPTLDDINAKLSTFGGELAQGIGEVLSANFCSIKDHQSLHLLMGTQDNPTSVFVLPKHVDMGQLQEFNEATAHIIEFDDAKILVLGDVAETVSSIALQIHQELSF